MITYTTLTRGQSFMITQVLMPRYSRNTAKVDIKQQLINLAQQPRKTNQQSLQENHILLYLIILLQYFVHNYIKGPS